MDPEDKSLTSLIDNSGLLSDATMDPDSVGTTDTF